jgi:hypothetical protein
MRALLLIAFVLNFCCLSAQTISGYVYDEDENKPLEGAFVYLDGTTLSASTDARGFFKIVTGQKYNASLVISFVGFETMRVQDPYKYGKPFKVLLRTDAVTLNEVVITKGGPFTRKQMLRAFREHFLGTSRAGSSCKIENEDDITLYFDLSANTLRAQALKPIRVVNKRLEYKANFDLMDFSVAYSTKTLDNLYMKGSFFAVSTFFTDISKKGSADKKRKDTYLGSSAHFMKTMAAKDWDKQEYRLFADKFQVDPNHYFAVSDSSEYKKVTLIDIPEDVKRLRAEIEANKAKFLRLKEDKPRSKYGDVRFSILYKKKMQSSLSFNNGYVYIDKNGLFFPLNEITFSGYLGSLKAGDLLPANYEYTP